MLIPIGMMAQSEQWWANVKTSKQRAKSECQRYFEAMSQVSFVLERAPISDASFTFAVINHLVPYLVTI